jgi:hypothetical protein
LGIFRRRRKVKRLSVWKSWAMDILVSPGTSDKYKIADAINEEYAEFEAKQNVVVPKSPLENGDQGGC